MAKLELSRTSDESASINQVQISVRGGDRNILFHKHTLKVRPEGSNYRNNPGVWLVYSDSTRRDVHAYIDKPSA